MMAHRSRIPYKHRIALVTFLIVAVPLGVACMLYFNEIYQEQRTQAVSVLRGNLEDSTDRYRVLLETCESKLVYVIANPELNGFLADDAVYGLDEVYEFQSRTRPVFEALLAGDNFVTLCVYTYRKDIFGNGQYLKQAGFLEAQFDSSEAGLRTRIESLASGEVLWCYRKLPVAGRPNSRVGQICAYKKLVSMNRTLAIVELRYIAGNVAKLFDFDLPKGSSILLQLDSTTEPVLLNAEAGGESSALDTAHRWLETGSVDGVETIALYARPGRERVLLFLPESYTNTRMTGFLMFSGFFFVILLVAIFLISELASSLLTRRLAYLLNRTDLALEKQWGGQVLEMKDNGDEFSQLSIRFSDLLARIKEYYSRVVLYEKEKRELELDLLQARINPHFLYNTLDTIKWVSSEPKIDRVIESLVRYYRIALNKGSNVIRIEQELLMVEEYLKLEQFTFDNIFQYRIDVPAEVRKCLIIKHILQPIVENAVLHGIAGMGADGLIAILGEIREDGVRLTVSDNGSGIDEDKIQEILSGERLNTMGGYGLGNVVKRIEMQYGTPFGLHFDGQPGVGTTVTVHIPAISEENILTN
jgi:two-component system sensor histidine kinase YesM